MELKLENDFRQRFNDLKKEIVGRKKLNLNEIDYGKNDGDDILKLKEEHMLIKLNAREDHLLKKIDRAIERIDKGNFGECLDCGEKVSLERLNARPIAELCIGCKEEEEVAENLIRYDKKSLTHNKNTILGKILYLKSNSTAIC